MQHEQLKFQKITNNYFHFLLDDYNFKLTNSDSYTVQYRKGRIYIEICHERISYEFYIVIKIGKYKSYLNQLLQNEGITTRFYQGSSSENVDFCLKHLANELQLFINNISLDNNKILIRLIKKSKLKE
jgi:hypothetical protein